jgi:hypothetical protein
MLSGVGVVVKVTDSNVETFESLSIPVAFTNGIQQKENKEMEQNALFKRKNVR